MNTIFNNSLTCVSHSIIFANNFMICLRAPAIHNQKISVLFSIAHLCVFFFIGITIWFGWEIVLTFHYYTLDCRCLIHTDYYMVKICFLSLSLIIFLLLLLLWFLVFTKIIYRLRNFTLKVHRVYMNINIS